MNITLENLEDVEVAVREWLEEPFVYVPERGICAQISIKVGNTLGSYKVIPIVRMSSDLLTAKFPPYSGDISYPISGHVEYFHHGDNKTLWQGGQLALRNQLIEVLKSADLTIEEDYDDGYLFIHFTPTSE